MKKSPFPLATLSVLFLFLNHSTTTTSSLSQPSTTTNTTAKPPVPPITSPHSSSTLAPTQLRALQSLNVPISKDPCFHPLNSTTTCTCDSSTPFRHLLSLHLTNCSTDLHISSTALKSLSSLTSFSVLNCPVPLPHFPTTLAANLRSFSSINSLKNLTGVFLSRFSNLTDLTVTGVPINASGPSIILNPMKSLHSVTISNTKLTGFLPKHWHLNLTHIDFSSNNLNGKIPISITHLENLKSLNLSSNTIYGEIPNSLGNLLSLQNLSLASNSLTGPIPDSISAMPELLHIDLGSNQLNGKIPNFISEMKNLKFLNLEKNNFHGVMPFNSSFINSLVVFKIGGNGDLCYNVTTFSSKMKLGIAPCDKHGLPILPPPAKYSSNDDSISSKRLNNETDSDDGEHSPPVKRLNHHVPNKFVLGVALGLSSVVFLIIFLVLLSKWCG